MAIATGRMTLEEFLKLPETKPASEYIRGRNYPKTAAENKAQPIAIQSLQRN